MPIERIMTFVRNFDEQIQGGIPKGSLVLIIGTPGTLKSTFAYSILYHNALEHETPGLFLSLEQRKRLLNAHLENIGFETDSVHGLVRILDLGLMRKMIDIYDQKKHWLNEFKQWAEHQIKSSSSELLVIDSLPALEILSQFAQPRIDLFQFYEWLLDLNVTCFLISELPDPVIKYGDEHFLADGLIHIKLHHLDDVDSYLRLACLKLRGTAHTRSYFNLELEEACFSVTPVISE